MENKEKFIDTLRHDTAHVMAMAVQELYPETKVTIGPVICLLYTSPSPRDVEESRMPSSA